MAISAIVIPEFTSRFRCRAALGTQRMREIAWRARSDVFDRRVKLLQRSRASNNPLSREVQYLRDEVARRLTERLYV